MLRKRRNPPRDVFPPDPWGLAAVHFDSEVLLGYVGQAETMFALSNGYLGIRGTMEEGRPVEEQGTYLNGFHESRPITYGESAYGFPDSGQSMLVCPDGVPIELVVDDEPFDLVRAETDSGNTRPNLIFLLTDDQRYDSLGCMGNPIISTPHIDGMAEDGVIFMVQGNIIASEAAMEAAVGVMEDGTMSLTDRVMAAMEATDALGGDARCTCQTEPLPGAACNGKTSHVAYILAADPQDPMGRFHANHPEDLRAPYNNGDYHLYLAVWPDNTRDHEDANPVRTLRMRYDAWKAEQEG